MADTSETLNELKAEVGAFCDERDWRQYHDAKELSIGITTEAGELLQHFRFKSKEQIAELFLDSEKKEEISHELADVLFFTLRFAEIYDLDLSEALKKKIQRNAQKYPVEKVKGNNKKYSEY